jgi:hypothetical protein
MCFAQHAEQGARSFDALPGIGAIPRMVQHHVAQHHSHIAPGERIVADERHALRRQALAADSQQSITKIVRDPRIQSLSDDVGEFAHRRTDVA